MSQFGMQMPGASMASRKASMNVYTGLMFAAVVCLAAAVALMWQAATRVSPKTGAMAPFSFQDQSRIDLPNAK